MDMRDNLSLVIGKNNTGKTSLLNVLGSFLNSSGPEFSYEDFSINRQLALQKAIIADTPEYPSSAPKIELELEIRYDEEDNLKNLSKLMVDLSPEARAVHLRFRVEINQEKFLQLHTDVRKNTQAISTATGEDLTEARRSEENQRFVSKRVRHYLTHSIESYDPADGNNTLSLTNEPGLVRSVIRLEFVSARRSVENRPAGKSGRAAGRALSQLTSDYFEDRIGDIRDSHAFIQLTAQAANTDRQFTDAYKQVFKDVIKKVSRFGAADGLRGDLHVVSDIQPDSLLKNNTSVRYGELESPLPEDHNGLGYLNLIAIIIEIEIRLLRMTGKDDIESADINILFIEEPEAHTHPQLQYVFIKQIKNMISEHCNENHLRLQTVLTTHSSHITAEGDFSDIKYFRRIGERVESRNMTDLEEKYSDDKKSYHFLKQYLTLTRAELFFADKAVLIEGDTERILMRAMMRKLDAENQPHEFPLSSQNVSVVEVGAHSQIFDHFIDFTGIPTLVLTDIDSAKVHTDMGKTSLRACAVEDGSHTTNDALNHYFGLTKSGHGTDGDLADLIAKPAAEKSLSKASGSWKPTKDGAALFVAYQTEEDDYHARSYEDAFIHINRAFIKENLDHFRGLKHKDKFDDETQCAYVLARDCVAKKTHFALDVIHAESEEGDISWKTPSYIAEGLKWLRDVT